MMQLLWLWMVLTLSTELRMWKQANCFVFKCARWFGFSMESITHVCRFRVAPLAETLAPIIALALPGSYSSSKLRSGVLTKEKCAHTFTHIYSMFSFSFRYSKCTPLWECCQTSDAAYLASTSNDSTLICSFLQSLAYRVLPSAHRTRCIHCGRCRTSARPTGEEERRFSRGQKTCNNQYKENMPTFVQYITWFTHKKTVKRNDNRYQVVIWHCVNIEFVKVLIKDRYLKPSSTHCLSPAESCAPFIMYCCLRIASTHRAAWTSHHWSLNINPTQEYTKRVCFFSITVNQMFDASTFLLNYFNICNQRQRYS